MTALPDLPVVARGDDLVVIIRAGLAAAGIELVAGDVLVVTSKIVSRAEGRFVDLRSVEVSAKADELAATIDKDPRLVELILRDSQHISRTAPGVLVVRHRLGFISANAGIDASNARPAGGDADGEWVLLLPDDPDESALRLRNALHPGIGVVVSDSLGRPFRIGTVGAAIGVAGLPAVGDERGHADLFGRELEATVTAPADQVAAAADLVAGQAAQGRAVVHIRGLAFAPGETSSADLLRPPDKDLYA